MPKTIGFQILHDSFIAVSVDENGKVGEKIEENVPREEHSDATFEKFAQSIKSEFGGADSVGIALPGLIETTGNKLLYSARFPTHEEIDFPKIVNSVFGVKAHLFNDANAAAYAEFKIGAGQNASSLFYATFGEGVGGAFIFDGKLWHGASGVAGEFGYVAIDGEGTRLEDVAAAAGVVRRVKNRMHQDNTSTLFQIDEESITLQDIISASVKGDYFAEMMLGRTGMFIGIAVASVVNLLNIECVVLGGELLQQQDFVIHDVREQVEKLAFEQCVKTCSILKGELGHESAAIGAAMLAVQ